LARVGAGNSGNGGTDYAGINGKLQGIYETGEE